MAKILIVEDDQNLLATLKYNLLKENYSVVTAAAGAQGVETARKEKPGLIILDVMLPELDGFETLETLRKAGLRPVGAGRDAAEAEAPAIMEVPGRGRVITFSLGSVTAGIPPDWAASEDEPGVNLLEATTIPRIAKAVRRVRRPGDIVVKPDLNFQPIGRAHGEFLETRHHIFHSPGGMGVDHVFGGFIIIDKSSKDSGARGEQSKQGEDGDQKHVRYALGGP